MRTEEYFKNNQLAIDVFNKKYALTKEDGQKENVLEVFTRVATGLAVYEEDPQKWIDMWVKDLMEGWYRPGGSIIAGVHAASAALPYEVTSTAKSSMANCTTIPLREDSIESINKCMVDMMKCASRRQGLGCDGSALRPRGSKVNNSAVESTGAVPWLDYLQSMGKYVGQKGRLPACLLSLNISHPDIEEFCSSKIDLSMILNANISVQITDDFMETVKADGMWELKFTSIHETISRMVNARELFNLISKNARDSAEPGVQFIDNMKRGSMIHRIYEQTLDERFKIISTNACSEKPLPAYSECVLGSMNMGMFPIDPLSYSPLIKEKTRNLLRLLDNAIQYELDNKLYGVIEQKEIMELTREVGMGITNLHQWFINANVAYDSDEAIKMIDDFMKEYSCAAFKSSQELATEKGPALGAFYIENALDPDRRMEQVNLAGSTFFDNVTKTLYGSNSCEEAQFPLRNLALMSIAPAGTITLIFPEACISTGCEPFFGPAYWKKTRAMSQGEYDYYFVFPEEIKNYLITRINEYHNHDQEEYDDLEFLKKVQDTTKDNTGVLGVEVLSLIDRYIGKGFFKPAHKIDPFKKIDMLAAMYKWVDAAISVTYNLPEDVTTETINKIYLEAWEKGVRAVSVYREGSREGILVFDPPGTDQKKKDVYCTERPADIIFNCAPKRPTELPCEIHHCKIQGESWLVLVGLLNNYPYELFAGKANNDEMPIPATVKNGVLKKSGKSYSLIIPIRKSEIEFKDIANVFMQTEERALTRMISLSLRHGARPAFIIDQMKKADEGITYFSTVVCRILKKYMSKLDYSFINKSNKEACSYCNGTDWVHQGGCMVCANCGKGSKCD